MESVGSHSGVNVSRDSGSPEQQTDTTLPVIKPSAECLKVLRLLVSMGYLPAKIAVHLKKSRKNVYKHINFLVKNNFFHKIEGVTRDGEFFLTYHSGGQDYRINRLQVFFDLPVGVDREKWKKNKGRVLSLKKIQFEPLRLGAVERFERFWLFDRFDCRVHSTGVFVFFPNIFAKNGLEAELIALGLVRNVAEELSKIFKGVDFLKDNALNVRFTNYEIAHLSDSIAQELHREGKKLYIRLDGQLRMICDFSHKIDEMEAVTVEHGLEDQFALQSHIKDILKGGKDSLKPSEALLIITKQAEVNEKTQAEVNELRQVSLEMARSIKRLAEEQEKLFVRLLDK